MNSGQIETEGTWMRQGNFIYSLMHHAWRKGVASFRNKIDITVHFDSSIQAEERERFMGKLHELIHEHFPLSESSAPSCATAHHEESGNAR